MTTNEARKRLLAAMELANRPAPRAIKFDLSKLTKTDWLRIREIRAELGLERKALNESTN
jgi:hypothetical protein